MALVTNTTPEDEPATAATATSQAVVASTMMPVVVAPSAVGEGGVLPPAVKSACSIISRFPNSHHPVQSSGFDLVKQKQQSFAAAPSSASVRLNDSTDQPTVSGSAPSGSFIGRTGRLSDSTLVNRGGPVSSVTVAFAAPARMGRAAPATSSSIQPAKEDSTVQCNEISSSEDTSPRSAERTTACASAAAEGDQLVSTSPLSELVSSPLLSSTAAAGLSKKSAGKSLSRELSALRLSSAPSTPSRKTSSRLASSSSKANKRMTAAAAMKGSAAASLDTENRHANLPLPVRNHYLRRGTPSTAALPASSFSDVERRCRDLHATLDSMEQRSLAAGGGRTTTPVRRPPAVPLSQQQQQTRSISKTSSASSALVRKNNAAEASSSPHCLRPSVDNNSSAVGGTPSRSLRSRTAVSATPAVAASAKSVSGTKRRRPLSVGGGGCAAAKSPRTAAGVVVVKEKAAVVNRSRQARVLRLKK